MEKKIKVYLGAFKSAFKKMNNYQSKATKLNKISRVKWANLPTSLEKLENLNSQFKDVNVYMKRDDLTGHCFGGNKERKLEFIMADVLERKATVVVTVGTFQSNHCRMTTAFSNKLGLKTELILIENNEEKKQTGNFLLSKLLGAKIHAVKVTDVQAKIDQVLNELRDKGENPYFIESGGHNVLGTIGYVDAVKELKEQIKEMDISVDYIVLPSGTGTTQAGLVLGKEIFSFNAEIIGISVARSKERCFKEISAIIDYTKNYLDCDFKNIDSEIRIYDQYIGRGYGTFTKKGIEAMKLLAKTEVLIIDPIYNAKAFSGMLDLISKSVLRGNVIYLNTGGLPGLFSN